MGNQMFQCAFGFAAGRRLGTSFFMNRMPALRYFDLFKRYFWKNWLKKIWFDTAGYFQRQIVRIWEERGIGPQNYAPFLADHCYYFGYFQSESYFKEYKSEIHRLFTIRKRYQRSFLDQYGLIFKTKRVVAVHVRRTDYREHGFELPVSYYRHALALVENLEHSLVIFVTDDVEETRRLFDSFPGEHLYASNSEIVDFQIIQNADVAIIANSSFSWWAAYLNPNPRKIIYGPKYWLGFKEAQEIPEGIMYPGWEWVNVEAP